MKVSILDRLRGTSAAAPASVEPGEAPPVAAAPVGGETVTVVAAAATAAAAPAAPAPAVAAPAAAPAGNLAADIAQLCADRGVPQLAATLIREGVSLEVASTRAVDAEAIRGLVAKAGKVNAAIDPKLADQFITAGASPDHVRAKLFETLVAAQSPEIDGGATARAGSGAPDSAAVWDTALKANT